MAQRVGVCPALVLIKAYYKYKGHMSLLSRNEMAKGGLETLGWD